MKQKKETFGKKKKSRNHLFLKVVLIGTFLKVPMFFSPGLCPAGEFSSCPAIETPLPTFVHEIVVRAEELDKKGKHKKAARLLSEFNEKHPEHDFAYMDYDIGFFFHNAGKNKPAVTHLNAAVKKAPCFSGAWQLLAIAHQELKQFKSAALAMEKAADLSRNPDLKYQAALFWMEGKSPKKALSLLRNLEKTDPVKPEWLVALSTALGLLEKKVETARAMEKAARAGNNPDLWFHAAWLWLDADRPQNALGLLEHLAEHKNVKVNWLLALCNTYMALNKTLKAAQTMERAVTLDPARQNLYTAGVLWLQVTKPKRARKHLLKLVKLDPPKADWFVALAQSWVMSEKIAKAAPAMEKAFKLSQNPDHAYQAGVLRLQLEQPDKALSSLRFLEKMPKPKAEWMVAVSNAWVMKDQFEPGALAMERAAGISKKNNHFYRAAQLWLHAKKPKKALPILIRLARVKTPESKWLIALSNTHLLLNHNLQAAKAMERGARISDMGKHYYRAAMLWNQENNTEKTISLLRMSIAKKKAKSLWFIELATHLTAADEKTEALSVMNRVRLDHEPASLKYRAVLLWQSLDRPKKARPILEELCQTSRPEYRWLVSLVRIHMEMGLKDKASATLTKLLNLYPEKAESWKLAVWVAREKLDYAGAAAAMEVALRLSPEDPDGSRVLGHYYHMAGVPVKAARAFIKAAGPSPDPEDFDRLKDVFLGGKRYDLALDAARSALKAYPTPARWETVGDITFLMRKYEASSQAFLKAADLSDNPALRLKAAYALMKQEKLELASRFFKQVMELADTQKSMKDEASQALAYIKSIQALMP